MWNDIETTNDYLHFSVVSGTVADLIIESGDNPISIGVSGNWGSGKSSMVKMIGKELEKKDDGKQKYLFLEFNAWLYQGYDDAKAALLQAVTKKLSDEMKKRKINESTEESDKKLWNRFKKFAKRVDWFKVSKLTVPLLAGLVPGAMPAGGHSAPRHRRLDRLPGGRVPGSAAETGHPLHRAGRVHRRRHHDRCDLRRDPYLLKNLSS